MTNISTRIKRLTYLCGMFSGLIQKYNVPGPRYTSYPTVPYWDGENFNYTEWEHLLIRSFKNSNSTEGISLYIHLPFCESLCTFCGCNKRITKQHHVETPYIETVLKEWELYCNLFPEKPIIKELHLGGGTPTFFSVENLAQLINGIFSRATIAPHHEFSFEGHPNNTTKLHLEKLFELGFTRVSFGVQDYNEKVQQAIHRIQPFENVERVTKWAREIGYQSIGHDLIFGLPFQSLDDILNTINKTNLLRPDRLAFYSYAHVPWIKGNGQRGFNEADLPRDEEKRLLYEIGKKHLLELGYVEIGMDHFALPEDSLFESFNTGKLHRNFMGYTGSKTQLMIGLGVSAIGDSWYAFGQNEKSLETYIEKIEENTLPIFRGHLLTPEDIHFRKHILNLMCRFETSWSTENEYLQIMQDITEQLHEMETDGLVEIYPDKLIVTPKGKPFVRNVCMAFDVRLRRNQPATELFSSTI